MSFLAVLVEKSMGFESWFTWWFSHQGSPSISPKRAPTVWMVEDACHHAYDSGWFAGEIEVGCFNGEARKHCPLEVRIHRGASENRGPPKIATVFFRFPFKYQLKECPKSILRSFHRSTSGITLRKAPWVDTMFRCRRHGEHWFHWRYECLARFWLDRSTSKMSRGYLFSQNNEHTSKREVSWYQPAMIEHGSFAHQVYFVMSADHLF